MTKKEYRRWGKPIRGNVCSYCGKKFTELSYQCNYCRERFCSSHCLPESHKCKELPPKTWKAYRGERIKRESVKPVREPPIWMPIPTEYPEVEKPPELPTKHRKTKKPSEKYEAIKAFAGIIGALAIVAIVGVVILALIEYSGITRSGNVQGPPSINISQLENETFYLVNQERIKYGLEPVTWSDQIAEVARLHSRDMAENNFFEHQNLQGQNVDGRLSAAGVGYFSCGEIILQQSVVESETTTWIFFIPIATKDYKTQGELAQTAVSGWMASSGHRAIILTSGFSKAGVGIYVDSDGTTYYFTGNFIS